MGRLMGGKAYGYGGGREPGVRFCDFCGDVVYRTLVVRVGVGDVVRGVGGEGQIKRASEYREACPGCAERLRGLQLRAELVEEMGKMLQEMVEQGATQGEIDEYVVGWGLDKETVKGFGVPEVERVGY